MKNKKVIKLLCLSLSMITVISLSSCKKDDSKESPTTTSSNGEDIVLYTTEAESTTKKSWFGKKKKEEKTEKKKDERVFCSDKKFFAVKSHIKGDETKSIIQIYSGETNELSVELIPTEDFTRFEWAENDYKLILYNGEKAFQAYKYNTKGDKWVDGVL